MERIRDGRRGNMAAVSGVSRRRPRSGTLRDSPEEDGGAEIQETSRFRERGSRKDRDRDRSTRSKRRRGDRLLHGSQREEGEDSTDESIDEDEEDDGDDTVPAARLPLPPPPPFSHPTPRSPPPVTLPTNQNPRKIFPSKVMRPPAVWKAADEMIGVSVPRKARSAHAKRSHECLPSGSGEQMHRQTSSSPSRSSQTSAAAAPPTPISPSSSNAPIRKKTKQISSAKQRPPKISKSSSIQEIEIEVAEVLYGLTRQFHDPSKTDAQAQDARDANGSCNETKSRASSPSCSSPPRAASQSQSSLLPHAPKRKRPRPVKYEDESPTIAAANASISSASKTAEGERSKMDISSPKSEKTTSSPAENGRVLADSSTVDTKPDIIAAELETSVHSKEPRRPDGNGVAASMTNPVPADERCLPGEKFQIDLMAPPPGKTSHEVEPDYVAENKKPSAQYFERASKMEFLKTEEGSRYESTVVQETRREESSEKSGKISPHPDAQLDVEKGDKVKIGGSRQPPQRPQQSKPMKTESRPDSAGLQSGPVPLPAMSVAGWAGGLPFGYVGQVPSLPAIVPVDGSAAAAKALQLRPRRCATHCYIAQNIYYQQLTRMNPYWQAKPYNLNVNVMPGTDHSFPARPQDGKTVIGTVHGQPSKDKGPGFPDPTAQRKQQQQQLVLQQPLQAGAAGNNILPPPAFIFPINQPPASAASAPVNRSAAAAPDASAAPAAAGAFNYGNLTQGEAQYLVLQNHGYPFPIPAHVGAPPYRGAAQALPFFNGSLYASQILHPSQLHQQQPPPQGHQNASNSTGSSSSQKHNSQKADHAEAPPQQKRAPPPHLPPRQMDGEPTGGDSPNSVDSRISHKGGLYGHNFVMPLNPQNFALMALGGDKSQHPHASSSQSQQQQGMKVELAPSQAFAMSFASFNGAVAAATAAASGQPHALDFSSAAQSHAIFQSLPEAARHALQAQHKKSQQQQVPPDKSLPESINSAGDDARKTMLAGKPSSRGNVIDGSSTRVMNMMNGSTRAAPSRSDVAAPPASSSSSTPHQQQRQQQHLLQLQKQHHHHHHQPQQQPQQLQMQQQQASRAAKASGGVNSAASFSERLSGGAAMSKLPNALTGIPQALVQASNNSPAAPPQWKNSANPRSSSTSAVPSPPSQIPTNPPAAAKNSHHHQGRTAPSPQSQQISFGIRPSPASAPTSSSPTAAAATVASQTSSAARSMSGSPRASPAAAKIGPLPGSSPQTAPHQPKGPAPGGHARNNGKSSAPSILGQPHIATSPGGGIKQPQQQSQKQQAFPPPQIFFANSYLQQQPPGAHSLTLGGGGASAATPDSQAKTAAPPNSGMKGIPFISAGGFPYFHGMSSVPVKPAEHKPAAGS